LRPDHASLLGFDAIKIDVMITRYRALSTWLIARDGYPGVKWPACPKAAR
jgi:hypothetical protein